MTGRVVTQPPPTAEPAWLRVRVGDGLQRVPLALVRAVIPMPPVTRVPGAPPFLRGLIAWRGRVLPVVSVAAVSEVASAACAVVAYAGETVVALAVDAVEGFVGPAEAEGEVLDLVALMR